MRQTLDMREIPSHYVPLTTYGGTRGGRKGKRVENWEYRRLRERWYAGELEGIKLLRSPTDDKGTVYVNPAAAESLIAEARAKRASVTTSDARAARAAIEPQRLDAVVVDAAIVAALHSCAESIASLLGGQASVLNELRRIADAAEAIATQPNESVGSWRDMNGEAMN